jgi:hypothetical protein
MTSDTALSTVRTVEELLLNLNTVITNDLVSGTTWRSAPLLLWRGEELTSPRRRGPDRSTIG